MGSQSSLLSSLGRVHPFKSSDIRDGARGRAWEEGGLSAGGGLSVDCDCSDLAPEPGSLWVPLLAADLWQYYLGLDGRQGYSIVRAPASLKLSAGNIVSPFIWDK